MLVCRDESKDIQAIGWYKERNGKYELVGLVTHPDNIKCSVNSSSSNQVRGAGTQIILYLVRDMIKFQGKFIKLDADMVAIPFYEKMKFTATVEKHYTGLRPMRLTIEKVKELVQQNQEPYSQLIPLQ